MSLRNLYSTIWAVPYHQFAVFDLSPRPREHNSQYEALSHTMSDYKTFAIWGAGTLGGRIAARLLDRKATVIILSRPVRSHLQIH
jgi:phosphoglycerate dehydrogenase-like enzyme